jgi:type I restriction enzyme R subunit
VLTRPRDLTRKQLKELVLALDQGRLHEARLATAWRELSNQDIAARIIGYIRQAAMGDALLPYAERVDHALQAPAGHPPGGKPWTHPQRDWLKRIAAQTKANLLVDRAALDDPDLIFKREGGGFNRLDKIFNGQLQPVLEAFNDALWADCRPNLPTPIELPCPTPLLHSTSAPSSGRCATCCAMTASPTTST